VQIIFMQFFGDASGKNVALQNAFSFLFTHDNKCYRCPNCHFRSNHENVKARANPIRVFEAATCLSYSLLHSLRSLGTARACFSYFLDYGDLDISLIAVSHIL
jgi:hypothetical protein